MSLTPFTAAAMRQCPPEFGSKSSAFWAMGWAVFALFALAGALLPWLMFRATRHAQMKWRWTLRLASIPGMLALWLLGGGIFLGQFVLAC